MAEKPQSDATHRRWFPLYHYVELPILVAGLVEPCLHGELETDDAVKRAVRDWRPDCPRA